MQACQESIKERNTPRFLLLGQKNKAIRTAIKLYKWLCFIKHFTNQNATDNTLD